MDDGGAFCIVILDGLEQREAGQRRRHSDDGERAGGLETEAAAGATGLAECRSEAACRPH